MSIRKRTIADVSTDDDATEQDVGQVPKSLKISLESLYIPSKLEIRPKPIELNRFNAMHDERQKACVKAIFRLFVFKGTKKEHLNRTVVGDVLAKVDQECKKHVSVVTSIVQPLVLKLTGYQIVPGDAIRGFRNGKREDLYLINSLLIPSPERTSSDVAKLQSILMDDLSSTSVSYQGFKFVIFHLIFSGIGQKITLSEIVRQLSKLDSRFPTTLSSQQLSSAGARDSLPSIPELGENLLEMLRRMQKEEYIVTRKDEADTADQMRNTYEFGPRFYLEVCQL
jgi:uncharacterized protein (UPF0212 family)